MGKVRAFVYVIILITFALVYSYFAPHIVLPQTAQVFENDTFVERPLPQNLLYTSTLTTLIPIFFTAFIVYMIYREWRG